MRSASSIATFQYASAPAERRSYAITGKPWLGASASRTDLGTVVSVVGSAHLSEARALGTALSSVGDAILAGELTEEATSAAVNRLGLCEELATRYVERLRDPLDGLVPGGVVDRSALANLIDLRTTWLPQVVDGRDVLAEALAEDSGLVDAG